MIGQLPSNLLLTRVSPQYVIPSVSFLIIVKDQTFLHRLWQLELAWGLATLGTYSVKSVKALYALRFLGMDALLNKNISPDGSEYSWIVRVWVLSRHALHLGFLVRPFFLKANAIL